ncbi:radical SAM protein, partial [Candidatus Woesearchaeota archaeon]|nr:radical SAM protein [Candidatus Woesearchaeota archaeon]
MLDKMKIHIKTFGCSANQADSEAMAGLLIKADYELTNSYQEADVCIVNSCTVKSPTERKVFRYIKKLEKANKKIIIAGCLPQAGQHQKELENHSVLGLFEINNAVNIVKQVAQGRKPKLISNQKKTKVGLPKYRKNSLIEIVPISEGCTGACTYCATRLAKGRLHSFPAEQIIRQIKCGLEDGIKEIWITSQDNASYGVDRRTNLISLLKKVCALEGDFKVRIGMMDPDNILKILDDLIEIYKHPKI